jgi:hypothetical protein
VTPPASPVDWEMELVMPLGVLANQLVKIEGDLRFLSMKSAEHSGENGARPSKLVNARLELINSVLESIHSLLAKVQSDVHPKETTAQFSTSEPIVFSHKSLPELDD